MFGSILMVLILVALLISVSVVKYHCDYHESASPQIAKWSFKLNDRSVSKTKKISLLDMQNQVIRKNRKIAPGFHGTVELEFDATDSEVDVQYCVEVIEEGHKPERLVFQAIIEHCETAFYSDLKELVGKELNDKILKSDSSQKKTAIISCIWPDEAKNDALQARAEENSYDYTFSLRVVGTEIKTTTTN